MIALIIALAVIAVVALVDSQTVDNPRGHIVVGTAEWHPATDLLTPPAERRAP